MFELKKPPRMKWYHWLLLPFAKRFITYDENVVLRGFSIHGHIYIYSLKQEA